MLLFKPSEELIIELLKYLRNTIESLNNRKDIKDKEPSKQLILEAQEGIGYTFRRAILEFSIETSQMPFKLCSIIEANKSGFTNRLEKILQKHLRVGSDKSGQQILDKFADEFRAWLKIIGEELKAEEDSWPYKRIYLIDNGTVIMDFNHEGVLINGRTIH